MKFTDLVDKFRGDLEEAGAAVLIASRGPRPAHLRVLTEAGSHDCLVYLWTITHGGGPARPADEWRVQMTLGDPKVILLPPRQVTILGGWSPEFGVYAFWDAGCHGGQVSHSPSLQIRAGTLAEAARSRVMTEHRDVTAGRECMVAVTPDSLLWYVQEGRAIHRVAEDVLVHVPRLMDASVAEEAHLVEEAEGYVERARRHELVQLMRPWRDATFRKRVLDAYGNRCAVCRTSLRLVDAAHIVPVTEPDASDEVANGVALCRLHHGAYDMALLGVMEDYSVEVNQRVARQLQVAGRADGLQSFRDALPGRIVVPDRRALRPNPRNLARGLEVRGWPRPHTP